MYLNASKGYNFTIRFDTIADLGAEVVSYCSIQHLICECKTVFSIKTDTSVFKPSLNKYAAWFFLSSNCTAPQDVKNFLIKKNPQCENGVGDCTRNVSRIKPSHSVCTSFGSNFAEAPLKVQCLHLHPLLAKWIASAGYYDTEKRRKRVVRATDNEGIRRVEEREWVRSLSQKGCDKRKVWWESEKKGNILYVSCSAP